MSSEPEPDLERDSLAVTNYLVGGNLETLWSQFDKNGDGYIDKKEFENLIYVSLRYFCQQRDPDSPPPTKDILRPHIKTLIKQLQPFVDKDKDNHITMEEFRGYGTYLTAEFKKLQKELNADKE